MRICVYYHDNDIKVGLVRDNKVIDIALAYKSLLINKGYSEEEAEETVDSLILYPENIALTWNVLQHLVDELKDYLHKISPEIALPISEVKLLPPLPQPQKIIGIALNYEDLAAQMNRKISDTPMFFFKAPSAIIGPYEPIEIPSDLEKVDYEAELVVVIKDITRNIAPEEAWNYILGYTIGNDVTSREIQYGGGRTLHSWSKSLDTFAPIGPWIVTSDEIDNPQNLFIKLWINDELYQDSNTRNMHRKINEIIAEASKYVTLYPGDLIFTGTPAGTGFALNPPRFLKDGDIVKIEIEKIGTLINPVKKIMPR